MAVKKSKLIVERKTSVKSPKNLGVSASWNLIMELLRNRGYTHVAILNDDVVWKREAEES